VEGHTRPPYRAYFPALPKLTEMTRRWGQHRPSFTASAADMQDEMEAWDRLCGEEKSSYAVLHS